MSTPFEFKVNLHDKQMKVFKSQARFKVCGAGRRFGKSYLATIDLITKGLECPYPMAKIWYIAPTYGQAEDIMWTMLLELGGDLIVNKWKNKLTVELINGMMITLKGADKPDTLVGSGLYHVVLDEFADMKPEVWEQSIRPALTDHHGSALFIGTPEGKNHFYEVWLHGMNPENELWESFQFNSLDNPIIDEQELAEAAKSMTKEMFAQEFEANFSSGGGGDLKSEDIVYLKASPETGTMVIAMDPAGYGEASSKMSKSKLSKADEHAIVVAEVSSAGWFIHDVIHGRWGIREASLKLVRAAQQYQPTQVGIEQGALSNAIMPYVHDQMARIGTFFKVVPLKHGGKKKQDRIMWSLQGRLENGRIFFKEDAPWIKAVLQQFSDFPNPMAHDDLIDAMAYIDQLAKGNYGAKTLVLEDENWDDTYWDWQ